MRIVQIVPYVGNRASGPSYSCIRLSQEIASFEHDVVLVSLKDGQSPPSANFSHRIYPKSRFPSFLWRSPELRNALDALAEESDLLHSNGLWLMPNVYPGWAAEKARKPLVTSTRGTLSDFAWNRSRLKKRLFWAAIQGNVLERADMLHATSGAEYTDIRRRGLRQPVCIIPNGIDMPVTADPESGWDERRRLLFLARIHPTKGVDVLLNAWALVCERHPDWDLEIAGPDNGGYLEVMQAHAARLGVRRTRFIGPLYGAEKLDAYQRAELYVLPTRSENFGITVAEALAAGTPAIVSKGAPWQGLERHGAGWWIDHGLEPLVACLDEALAMSPTQLRENGARGREWVRQEFSWQPIAANMIEAYKWLLGQRDRPECVRVE